MPPTPPSPQFDRERIPERVVHARGASAKGFFETTHDVSHLTCADLFRAPGVQTPVIARFSTVIHERGSPETIRDPRGFAVKFYTREGGGREGEGGRGWAGPRAAVSAAEPRGPTLVSPRSTPPSSPPPLAGNWDLVGNNMPVFFVRDGMKFPDMVHALKPNPVNHIQEGWRIADFFSHHPESLHMFTFLLDDVGIPLNYRHMEGFGVHTYTLLTRDGKVCVGGGVRGLRGEGVRGVRGGAAGRQPDPTPDPDPDPDPQTTFVKFHWKPSVGVKCLLEADAERVGGANHSHATQVGGGGARRGRRGTRARAGLCLPPARSDPPHPTPSPPRQDLFEAIASGDYPEWTLLIQTLDPAAVDALDFDPLDVTKLWPEDVFPLQPVGRMVLNKNPDNFFAENEMLAFCPALVVPGVGYSDDKVPGGVGWRGGVACGERGEGVPCRPADARLAVFFFFSCCKRASSPTPTPSATAWAPTTSSSPSTRPGARTTTTTTTAP